MHASVYTDTRLTCNLWVAACSPTGCAFQALSTVTRYKAIVLVQWYCSTLRNARIQLPSKFFVTKTIPVFIAIMVSTEVVHVTKHQYTCEGFLQNMITEVSTDTVDMKCFVHVSSFSHVLLLLVNVSTF